MLFELCLFVIDSVTTNMIEVKGQSVEGVLVHSQCTIDVPDICRGSLYHDVPSNGPISSPPISSTTSPPISVDGECTASDTNWEVALRRTFAVDLNDRRSTCFEYRFSNHDRNGSPCSDDLEYWMLSMDGDRRCPLHDQLVLALPASAGRFDVVFDDAVSGMHGYRWTGSLPQRGQYREYTVCAEGDGVESVDGQWAAVGRHGIFTKDGMTSLLIGCQSLSS